MSEIVAQSFFDDDYETQRMIGDGGYGSVFLAISRKDRSRRYAVKMLKKNGNLRPLQEAMILKELSPHPNILQFEACYDEKDMFYIVTEYLPHGDLFQLVTEGEPVTSPTVIAGPPQPPTEKECRRIVREILLAVKHLHDRGIVHRDLKLENILLTAPLSDLKAESIIKIIDFGFATHAYGASLIDSVGSFYYAAPEIYKKEPYGKSVDLWAIGVITFALLSGHFPFHSVDMETLKRKIVKGKFDFRSMIDDDVVNEFGERKQINLWDNISNEAKDFITAFLQINPKHRMLIDQALEHQWIQKDVFDIVTVVRVRRVCKKWRRRISQKLSKNQEEMSNNTSEESSPIKASSDDLSLIIKSPPINSNVLPSLKMNDERLAHIERLLGQREVERNDQDQDKYEVSQVSVDSDSYGVPCFIYHAKQTHANNIIEIITYELKQLTAAQRQSMNSYLQELEVKLLHNELQYYFTHIEDNELYLIKSSHNNEDNHEKRIETRACSSENENDWKDGDRDEENNNINMNNSRGLSTKTNESQDSKTSISTTSHSTFKGKMSSFFSKIIKFPKTIFK